MCLSFCSVSYLGSSLLSWSLSSPHSLSLVCPLSSFSFLLPTSLPLLSPPFLFSLSLLYAPSPLHLVSLFLAISFHLWKFSFFVCVSFGVLIPSSPFSSPFLLSATASFLLFYSETDKISPIFLNPPLPILCSTLHNQTFTS